jgi:hypothetical protein
MTEEERIVLRAALKEVHDQIHLLYPKNAAFTDFDKELRNQLLVVDLAVHLADEVIGSPTPNQQKVTERTANLLYAIKLIAQKETFEQAAKLLLDAETSPSD